MPKVMIKGRFATPEDVAAFHKIPPERQAWLKSEVAKAIAEVNAERDRKHAKRNGTKRSAKIARLHTTKK